MRPALVARLRHGSAATALGVATLMALASPVHGQSQPHAQAQSPSQSQSQSQSPAAARRAVEAQPQPVERQLEAIRQSLVRHTLETAPTRVLSTAWIDGEGRLHESAQFQTDARVRGVRVLSYLGGADEAEPTVKVSAPLPQGLGPLAPTDPQACAAEALRWRQPLALQQVQGPGLLGAQAHTGHTVLQLAGQALLEQVAVSRRWRAAPHVPVSLNSYERALLGPAPSSPGWTAVLQLAPAQPVAAGLMQRLGLSSAADDWTFELRLSVAHPLGTQALWQQTQVVSVPLAWRTREPSAWQAQLAERLQQHMQQWVRELDTASACEPLHFDVADVEGAAKGPQPWQLQAGAAHGLRLGDRLLIMDRRQLPQRILEPGAVQRLALAEVEQLGPQGARLRQLAGPALTGRGDWVALPF